MGGLESRRLLYALPFGPRVETSPGRWWAVGGQLVGKCWAGDGQMVGSWWAVGGQLEGSWLAGVGQLVGRWVGAGGGQVIDRVS